LELVLSSLDSSQFAASHYVVYFLFASGYSFRHTLFKPKRNFGIVNIELGPGNEANMRMTLYYRSKKRNNRRVESPFNEGELIISGNSF
jgi:hypothetical protein